MAIISIIVPIYKVEEYIHRCIDSILSQTFKDFECILVDDGSPDKCPVICDEYVKKDKRIKVIHKANGGLSDARNAGLNIARGKYILFVDGDDWIHPQLLELAYSATIDTGVDFVSFEFTKTHNYTNIYVKYDINNELSSVKTYDSGFIMNNLYNRFQQEIGVEAWKKLYKKEIFDNIRFRKGIIHEDDDIFIDILMRTKTISVIDIPLYFYFMSPSSIMRSDFSSREFIRLEIDWRNIEFINRANIVSQKKLCSIPYLEHYMYFYYAVKEHYPELKYDFSAYKKSFRRKVLCMVKNGNLSRAFLLLVLCFAISPYAAKRLYKKLF